MLNIVLFGPPGAGKSCVGQSLSEKLGALYYSKDEIKEVLFDSLGIKNSAWSRQLAVTANDILFSLIQKSLLISQDLIVETNISLEKDIKSVYEIFSRNSNALVEIYLTADKNTLMDRVVNRWNSGARHIGHVDNRRLNDIEAYIDNEESVPINLGHKLIKIDSSSTTISELEQKVFTELNLS